MQTQEESQEISSNNPSQNKYTLDEALSDDAELFRQGYGLGYLPEGFYQLSPKEKVKASFATLVGQHFSIQDLQFFVQLSDNKLPKGLSRQDVTFMLQKRLQWQADAIQLLLQDTPAPDA